MKQFVYGSREFRAELAKSPHAAGEVEFLESITRPDMRAIEIGATHGVTAVTIASRSGGAGWLYAFEPVPEYLAILERNLSRNHVENASAHPLAVTDRPGRIRFYNHGGGSGMAVIGGLLYSLLLTPLSLPAANGPAARVYRKP